MKTEDNFRLVKYLQDTPRGVSIHTIAEEFDVNYRTIIRKLAIIRSVGLCLMFTQNSANKTRYYWIES